MKRRSVRVLGILLLSLLCICMVMQNVLAEPGTNLGRWQGVVEGETGEGSTFFIFKFRDNGSVEITKQLSGNTIVEEKAWLLEGNTLQIISNNQVNIKDFEDNPLIRKDDHTFVFKIGEKDIEVEKWNGFIAWIHLCLVLILLIALNEICRHFKIPAIVFYFIIPIVLIPFWMNSGISHWFRWVKLYSVVFAAVWFTLVRFTKLGQYKFAKYIAAAILCINIAEAVVQDFSMGYVPNVLNAVGGILSIITLTKWQQIGPDNTAVKDMTWPAMTTFWIIAYDIWNWTFVYLNFPEHAAYHLMVLLSCTIPSIFIKKGTWLQARAFTLAGWMIYLFTFRHFIDSSIVVVPRGYFLMLAAGILSIGSNAIYAYFHFRWKFFKKAPSKLQVGQN